jgi:transcriptional regulator with XRE-family HTH domain
LAAIFGEILRTFRQASNDPYRHNRRLSQARLGELIGYEMGDMGYTGAAISYWESGESKINAEDRNVLIALITVLHKCGGLQTLKDANQLLEAGNYRALHDDEKQKVFGEITEEINVEPPTPKQNTSTRSLFALLLENLFFISEDEYQELITRVEEGPRPTWPRLLAAFMRKATDNWSLSLADINWIWVWWLAWWLIVPSLRWPFEDRQSSVIAMQMYIAGTLAIPLLIGLLVNTKDNEYWKQQNSANSKLVRLYTYQGAAIGFNVGYFFILPLVFIRYYLQLGSSIWLEIAAVTLGLILGNMAARVVPHNLWLAYKRLTLADGRIFFVVAFIGPLWGLFFVEYYSILLTPFSGITIILLALTAVVLISTWQARKNIS